MRWEHVLFVLGILLCLIGAFLMVEGSILGENTTGWATVIGIVGIGLIATSGAGFSARAAKTKKSQKETARALTLHFSGNKNVERNLRKSQSESIIAEIQSKIYSYHLRFLLWKILSEIK